MDWIKTGWGSHRQQEFSPVLPFIFDCSDVLVTKRPLCLIAADAIKKIVDNYPPPYYLMSSGGIDSQAMIYCWIRTGHPYHILSYLYNDSLNEHDVKTLRNFADQFQIEVNYRNFDLINFLDDDLPRYAHEYYCTSPQICAFMKICDSIQDGTIIFSGNFLNFTSPSLNYTILGMQRYACKRGNMIPFFFQHDAELAGGVFPYYLSFNPSNDYESKIDAYRWAGIPVIPQERKYSGYEEVKKIYDAKPNLITARDRLEFSSFPSKRIFDIHYRYKLTRSIKYIDELKYILPADLMNKYNYGISN